MSDLARIQSADLKGKIILLRVDHNVVKKGKIKDPFRIDASLPTLDLIIKNGGKPVIMTHIGRPRDKQTKLISISSDTAVQPIIDYLAEKKGYRFYTPQVNPEDKSGIKSLDLESLKNILNDDAWQGIYLPNTRWFEGEEAKDKASTELGKHLSSFCDIFVNDAFGSWQPHASTIEPTRHLPSYAGLLMQKEIDNLSRVLNPEKPLLAIIAGAKFDTKIGPLKAMLKKADHLVLGGVIYNAYLCARYGIKIAGITPEDVAAASHFIDTLSPEESDKLILPRYLVESIFPDRQDNSKIRKLDVTQFKTGDVYAYILDMHPDSLQVPQFQDSIIKAKTIFVNAVMGFTPHFTQGSAALYSSLNENHQANKLLGGGDTLQEFKILQPDIYIKALSDPKYYFFTGGGAILTAIEQDSPYGIEPVKALLK